MVTSFSGRVVSDQPWDAPPSATSEGTNGHEDPCGFLSCFKINMTEVQASSILSFGFQPSTISNVYITVRLYLLTPGNDRGVTPHSIDQ